MTDGGCRIAGGEDRESELAVGGWTRRSVVAPSRLDELTALYRRLGFEIRLEPVGSDGMEERCAGCAPGLIDCRAVYTRPAERREP
jgi:hypothetical protein